ncbi:MAG: DUF420 domain-containing protein [Acidobacteria bacterium]|nr:MAG: DUF420 domain-containing protein [Acidobacteriota bacterium]
MLTTSMLPTLNAILNGTSAVLLITGYLLIRRGRRSAHRLCMLSAFGVSTLFLVSYLVYHYHHGSTKFMGEGWLRPVYFAILGSHTILAAVIVPLVLITLSRALRRRFEHHKTIARWTLPLWLYVSVTGVLVYLMLYQLGP